MTRSASCSRGSWSWGARQPETMRHRGLGPRRRSISLQTSKAIHAPRLWPRTTNGFDSSAGITAVTRSPTSSAMDWPLSSSMRELRPGSSTGSISTDLGSFSCQPWKAQAPMPACGIASTRTLTCMGLTALALRPWSTHLP